MELSRHTFLIEPFDIAMHADEAAIVTLHSRFTNWLRMLNGPSRFMCWLMPATLKDKINRLTATQHDVAAIDVTRADLLMEYRRHYEALQNHSSYQHSLCGMALWSNETGRALASSMSMAFETYVQEGDFPALFGGNYRIAESPIPHFAPVERPGGRLLWAILTSYEFLPVRWDFGQPADGLLMQNFPMAICVDVPQTYDRVAGIEKIEGKIAAYTVHLSSLKGTQDSRAEQGVIDCRRALQEINNGDGLHRVQIAFAIGAPDIDTLRERVGIVQNHMRQWVKLRVERGSLLEESIKLFAGGSTKSIRVPDTTWTATSTELALLLAPMGYRKMTSTDGIMRGEAVKGGYPVFHNSWRDKRATHEIWVGSSGYGKTFMNNCYLLREYAENGIPFDLLEPMGHGRHLAAAIGITPYNLSARSTVLNPQDVMFGTLTEQISHTVRLYETVLGRSFSGGQQQNLERGLLAETLGMLYSSFPDLADVTPDLTPTCTDVVDVLRGLGDTDRKRHLARELADEIASLCCGTGPWARFLNGQTSIDLSRGKHGRVGPRVFMFNEMSDDPILLALAYTQVLSAIRRDSLIDEQPRIIAVDEVYRLMRYEPLLDFLIEAAKTFRTRNKKLISIDQNMRYFLEKKARYVFENSPIRVIFSQKQGMNVFHEDAAFQHFNQAHLQTIATLQRFHYVLDVQEEGIWYVYNNPSEGEVRRFRST